jgi:hypothetical protein
MSTPLATRTQAAHTQAFCAAAAAQIDERCYNFTPGDFINLADAHGVYLVDDEYDIDIDIDDTRLSNAITEIMEVPEITARCVAEALTDNEIAIRQV